MLDIVDRTARGRDWAIPPAEVMRFPKAAFEGCFVEKQKFEKLRPLINGLVEALVENNPAAGSAVADGRV